MEVIKPNNYHMITVFPLSALQSPYLFKHAYREWIVFQEVLSLCYRLPAFAKVGSRHPRARH